MDTVNNLKQIWYSNFLEKYHPKDKVSNDSATCEMTQTSNRYKDRVSLSGTSPEDKSASLIDEYLTLKSSHRRRLVRKLAET